MRNDVLTEVRQREETTNRNDLIRQIGGRLAKQSLLKAQGLRVNTPRRLVADTEAQRLESPRTGGDRFHVRHAQSRFVHGSRRKESTAAKSKHRTPKIGAGQPLLEHLAQEAGDAT